MAEVANLHERIRNAIAATMEGVLADLCLPREGMYRQNQYQATAVNLPCLVASYDIGSEQIRGGTNREDDVGFPVLLGYYTAGHVNDHSCGDEPDRPEHPGPTLTQFRDTVRALFHNRRLAGISEVYGCEVVPQPAVAEKVEGFEQLKSAMGVIAWARVERTPTWSKT